MSICHNGGHQACSPGGAGIKREAFVFLADINRYYL